MDERQDFSEPDFEDDEALFDQLIREARQKVKGPAIALKIVSGIWIVWVALAMGIGGTVNPPAHPGDRWASWWMSVMLLCLSTAIFLGAKRMHALESRGAATTACILALIPCLGPGFIFGIPFGIWGLIVLSNKYVVAAFDEQKRRAQFPS